MAGTCKCNSRVFPKFLVINTRSVASSRYGQQNFAAMAIRKPNRKCHSRFCSYLLHYVLSTICLYTYAYICATSKLPTNSRV